MRLQSSPHRYPSEERGPLNPYQLELPLLQRFLRQHVKILSRDVSGLSKKTIKQIADLAGVDLPKKTSTPRPPICNSPPPGVWFVVNSGCHIDGNVKRSPYPTNRLNCNHSSCMGNKRVVGLSTPPQKFLTFLSQDREWQLFHLWDRFHNGCAFQLTYALAVRGDPYCSWFREHCGTDMLAPN